MTKLSTTDALQMALLRKRPDPKTGFLPTLRELARQFGVTAPTVASVAPLPAGCCPKCGREMENVK